VRPVPVRGLGFRVYFFLVRVLILPGLSGVARGKGRQGEWHFATHRPPQPRQQKQQRHHQQPTQQQQQSPHTHAASCRASCSCTAASRTCAAARSCCTPSTKTRPTSRASSTLRSTRVRFCGLRFCGVFGGGGGSVEWRNVPRHTPFPAAKTPHPLKTTTTKNLETKN
jgi:hypothetical protein